jgi:hypothetical protein
MSSDESRSRSPRQSDAAEIPWARTTTPPTDPAPVQPPTSAPAVTPPVWSGRTTAIAAALAIGFSSIGAIGAAAALSSGADSDSDPGGRGFPGSGQVQPGGQPGQQGLPGQPDQQSQTGQVPHGLPGGVLPGVPDDDGGPQSELDDGTSTT